jgi:hypothetical protein
MKTKRTVVAVMTNNKNDTVASLNAAIRTIQEIDQYYIAQFENEVFIENDNLKKLNHKEA